MTQEMQDDRGEDTRPAADILRDFGRATREMVKMVSSFGPFRQPSLPFGSESARRMDAASIFSTRPSDPENGSSDSATPHIQISMPLADLGRGIGRRFGGVSPAGAEENPPFGGTLLAHSTPASHHAHPKQGMTNLGDFATSIWRGPDGRGHFVVSSLLYKHPSRELDFRPLAEAAGTGTAHLAWPSGGATVGPCGKPTAAGHAGRAVEEWLLSGSVPTALGSDGLNLVAGHHDGRTSHLALHREPFLHHGGVEHLGYHSLSSACPSAFFDLHIGPERPPGRPASPVVRVLSSGHLLATLHRCGTAHISIRPDIIVGPSARACLDTGWTATVRDVVDLDTSVPEHIVVTAAGGTHVIGTDRPHRNHLHLPPDSRLHLRPYSPSHVHLKGFHLVFEGGGGVRPLWTPTEDDLRSPKHHFRLDTGSPVHLRRGGPAQADADAASTDAWADFSTLPLMTVGESARDALRLAGIDDDDPLRLVALVPSRARAARGVTSLARLASTEK